MSCLQHLTCVPWIQKGACRVIKHRAAKTKANKVASSFSSKTVFHITPASDVIVYQKVLRFLLIGDLLRTHISVKTHVTIQDDASGQHPALPFSTPNFSTICGKHCNRTLQPLQSTLIFTPFFNRIPSVVCEQAENASQEAGGREEDTAGQAREQS